MISELHLSEPIDQSEIVYGEKTKKPSARFKGALYSKTLLGVDSCLKTNNPTKNIKYILGLKQSYMKYSTEKSVHGLREVYRSEL